MSQAIKPTTPTIGDIELSLGGKLAGMMPVIAPLLLALAFILSRLYIGPKGLLYEGAMTVLALISYISAAVILVTNLFVRENVLRKLGLWATALGMAFNLSGWMMRWIEAGDAEGWKAGINGIWRYFPLDNLYPLTLGFCFGGAITTLMIIRKEKYQHLGALSMPIVTVILTMAMMLGNHISTLPPILDSYWRPIHVSIATIAYGVCLVSFGLAVAYLLRDGVRTEALAIVTALFGVVGVYVWVGHSQVPLGMEYGASVMMGRSTLPVRATLPGVGPLMELTLITIALALVLFAIDWFRRDAKANRLAWRLFAVAAGLQAVVLGVLFYQLKQVDNVVGQVPASVLPKFGQWLATQNNVAIPPAQYATVAQSFLQERAKDLTISAQSNPVEMGGLIGLFVALVLVALFAWKRERVISALPQLPQIDALLYRTVGVAFPLLSLLLITGAVWANESWGRYWGWDSKEVGALVAWMAYAGFLHTRIAHGWRGRRSAYFALLGFALVIFTWLGVSFLLPGLHSYAEPMN
ncbi:MAG TPA: cytochrome c biogenesis protein CcsA [Blastocatellia bacterium]|nr:cytochrome c biogenesis protein CcsA [Blastocatellia bacterium]